MELKCPNCGDRVTTNDGQGQITFVTREATEAQPAVHLIMETSAGGTWLLHRCLIAQE